MIKDDFQSGLNSRKKRLGLEQPESDAQKERVKRFKREIGKTSPNFEQGSSIEKEMMDFQYSEEEQKKKQLLNSMINEIINQNQNQNQKQKQNQNQNNLNYNGVLGNRLLIHDKASEIRSIPNLLERRKRVKNLYELLKLFSGLYGRKEFNSRVMTLQDLDAVIQWLNKTDPSEILQRYRISIPTVNECSSHWIKPQHWRSSHNCLLEEYKKEYDGSKIGISLHEAKARLEQEIQSMTGSSNKTFILSLLNDTFIRHGAADSSSMVTHGRLRWFSYSEVEETCYYRNGVKMGRLFQETGGKRYGIKEGCFGHEEGFYKAYYREAWEKVQVWFEKDLKEMTEALQTRATQLFDLETNPESPLQELYRHSYKINNAVIPFPSREVDALVKQCNEFIKCVM